MLSRTLRYRGLHTLAGMLMVYFPAASVATETDQLGAVASGGAVTAATEWLVQRASCWRLPRALPCRRLSPAPWNQGLCQLQLANCQEDNWHEGESPHDSVLQTTECNRGNA